ncbi:hypothetical protein C3L33_06251, partial [Rhododendron williamsianum]
MTELEREIILSERATKKDDKVMREKMRSKRNNKTPQPKKEKLDSSPRRTSSRGLRSSARSADRAAAKDDALNELRAKRLKHQDPDAQRKLRDTARGKRGSSPIKRKNFTAATSISSSSRSESGSDSEDEESTGDGGMMVDSDEEKTSRDSDLPKFEDIKEITIQRSKLAKWLMEPFFDELIVGCFVRVGIGKSKTGPIYRLCMVRNVDASDPNRQYKLENKTTSKYLNVIWGNESSAARWQMAMVSDSPPIKDEFDQWVREVERSGGRMLSKREVAGYDPFSRRWTRSRNYYVSKANEGGADEAAEEVAVATNDDDDATTTTGGVAATAAALEAAADAGKLVDTRAPVDQGTESNVLHDFDLPISLAVLQKFGGPKGVQAGFMARKQRIEATVGCQVPVDDGRRHALTLTVSDYKRRRGLL